MYIHACVCVCVCVCYTCRDLGLRLRCITFDRLEVLVLEGRHLLAGRCGNGCRKVCLHAAWRLCIYILCMCVCVCVRARVCVRVYLYVYIICIYMYI